MEPFLIYICAGIACFLVGVLITRWIFQIDKIVRNLDSQNKAAMAQLHLLASIADKNGVDIADINEAIKDFGWDFEK